MTTRPGDRVDVVVPAGGPSPTGRGARVGLRPRGVAAALAGLVAAALIVAGCDQPPAQGTPSALPSALSSAPPSAPPSAGAAACRIDELQGQVVGWEGAAGSSMATVTLRSTAAAACRVMDYQLALVDGAGRGLALIVGTDILPGFTIEPGQTATTVVQASNYCLAATPREPVSLRLDGAPDDVVFEPASDGSSGVPPCNGPGLPGSISQQPWQVDGG